MIMFSIAVAKRYVAEIVKICYEAALRGEAPEYCVQWIEKPNMIKAEELMCYIDIALILETGAHELIKTC